MNPHDERVSALLEELIPERIDFAPRRGRGVQGFRHVRDDHLVDVDDLLVQRRERIVIRVPAPGTYACTGRRRS
jgi:hypothetical protein